MDALYKTVAAKWKPLGIYLEISNLDSIAERCRGDPQNCLVELLETWLKKVNPPCTWATLIEALSLLGEEQLAGELREKYNPDL